MCSGSGNFTTAAVALDEGCTGRVGRGRHLDWEREVASWVVSFEPSGDAYAVERGLSVENLVHQWTACRAAEGCNGASHVAVADGAGLRHWVRKRRVCVQVQRVRDTDAQDCREPVLAFY